jgi:hypothetical protein
VGRRGVELEQAGRYEESKRIRDVQEALVGQRGEATSRCAACKDVNKFWPKPLARYAPHFAKSK